MRIPSSIVLALFTSGALLTSACEDKKVKECNQVAKIANDAVTEMHKLERRMQGEAHEAAGLAKDAKAFIAVIEGASKEISAVELTTEPLKPHVQAYTAMLDAAAAASKELIASLEDAEELSEAKLTATEKAMEEAQKGLATACQGEVPDCEKIAAVMEKFAADHPTAGPAVSDALRSHATELEAIEIEEAAVKSAKLAYTAVLRDYANLFAKALELDSKIEGVNIAVENEDAIVTALNQVCSSS